MNEEMLRDLQHKLELISKPLDVEKYITDGFISRLTHNSKTKFFVNGNPKELPEDINARIQKIEVKQTKDGSSKVVVTLNLKVVKS
ncbi:hypothetical protein [Desulfomicrobium apsheronum]|uniref:hypothetical protein n=1 Tax=Desulfomicrobium apsheronum TaxID=52560 RepID=UPI001160743B|nr:hypothetical protein [Desulfomicrobium apsheronum]